MNMGKINKSSGIREKREVSKKRSVFFTLLKLMLLLSFIVIVAAGAGLFSWYFYLIEDLPKISSLNDYRPPIITTVYSDDNRKIGEFYIERRIIVPLSEMPNMVKEAFIAAEDARFYKHQGIDLLSIVRAFLKNLEAGTIVQGGSTITQQVTKSFFLSPERSYTRKVKEAILAYRIDRRFTKDNILFLYLNQIYLGHGAYGVQAASENYFGKSAKDLNLAECAMLAGLPQAPSRYSPFRFPEKAKQRQIYVLNRMVAVGYITNIQATEAINTKLDIKPRKNWYIEEVPIYTEQIRRYVEEKYGEDALYKGGLQIHTAVNIEMQKTARREVRKGLLELDKRQGYRGPLQQLRPEEMEVFAKEQAQEQVDAPLDIGKQVQGIVVAVDDKEKNVTVRMGAGFGILPLEEMNWARKPNPEVPFYTAVLQKPSKALSVGDVILVRLLEKPADSDRWGLALEQEPEAQSALLCIEVETGLVKVMIGGRDFQQSQFNRAVQSRRQPGSAFKPVIYAAAIDKGYTPASVLIDSPIVYRDFSRNLVWKPQNYSEKFYGPTLLRKALAKSVNVVAIKLMRDIGIDYVIQYARKLGIESPLYPDLALALGASGISLLEMVRAYSIFANAGYRVEPIFITKITDRDGRVLEENHPEPVQVIDKTTAYIMTSLLESVVQNGTGQRVKALGRPVAGKTGTTNNLFDAWFVGYTPQYVTGVWVGFDEEASLGWSETGARAAIPIWLGFMQEVVKDKEVRVFEVPEGVVFSKIDAKTGLLAAPESEETIFECFKEGTAPTKHTPRPGVVSDSESFFKMEM